MSIEQFIVTLLKWLGFDKEPDEGRRRFMLGMVFTAATVQFGIALPKLAKTEPPRTATLESISDMLKRLYSESSIKAALYQQNASSPMFSLWAKTPLPKELWEA